MSDGANKENNLIFMDKIITDEKTKEEFSKPNEKNISFDEKDDDETLKNETSPNSPYLSMFDNTVELSNQSCEKINDHSSFFMLTQIRTGSIIPGRK